jgi:hypothetical protein
MNVTKNGHSQTIPEYEKAYERAKDIHFQKKTYWI